MKRTQIIEYAVVAIIILVPVFALTSVSGQLRVDRIDYYLGFPSRYQEYTPTDKLMIDEVRDMLLKNSGDKFYDQDGLTCFGNEFMQREQNMFALLAQLACMPQGSWNLNYKPYVRDCNAEIQKDAIDLIGKTIELDTNLFNLTAQRSGCEMQRDGTFLEYGQKILECKCRYPVWN